MPHEPTAEHLAFFADLVQRGFIEEVNVEGASEPSYRIASRFLDATTGPGDSPETRADQSFMGGSRA
jgi:hypothetical protein